jgi:DNA-binding transcriptional LysR family regulator
MELRQLNALVAVGDHGSFSAAAEALETVQSNVSTHVRKLEDELGTVLVDRSAGCLTPAGELVAARAKRISGELDALTADVTALDKEVSGTVRLGIIGTAARWLIPQLLDIVPTRYPEVRLVVVEGTREDLSNQLTAGKVDIAVITMPALGRGVELTTVPLFEEDIVLVVPHSHPLAGREVVELTDLHELPLLLPLAGTSFRDELDALAWQRSVKLRPLAQMHSVALIASLAAEGCGPSVLPAGGLPSYLRGSLAAVPLVGMEPRVVGAMFRRRGTLAAPGRAVLDVMTEVSFDAKRVPEGIRGLLPDLLVPERPMRAPHH